MTASPYRISRTILRGRRMGMTVQKRSVSLTSAVTYGTLSSTRHLSHASPSGYADSMAASALACTAWPLGVDRKAMAMMRLPGTVSSLTETMVRQMDLSSASFSLASESLSTFPVMHGLSVPRAMRSLIPSSRSVR